MPESTSLRRPALNNGRAGDSPKTRKAPKTDSQRVTRFADMLSAMGAEPRLRIMQLLLKMHPEGLVVGDIQATLGIAPSTLSHHLDKLKHEGLVRVRREKKFLRYAADPKALEELLQFLFAECCASGKAVNAERIIQICC
jgi:DNA-binding transcriptional ArsR family regulator